MDGDLEKRKTNRQLTMKVKKLTVGHQVTPDYQRLDIHLTNDFEFFISLPSR